MHINGERERCVTYREGYASIYVYIIDIYIYMHTHIYIYMFCAVSVSVWEAGRQTWIYLRVYSNSIYREKLEGY